MTARRLLLFAGLWVVFRTGSPAQPLAAGGFVGRIVTDGGVPVRGATVAYHRVPAVSIAPPPSRRVSLQPGERQYGGAIQADAQGLFRVVNAPAGSYRYCVIAEGFLDPCRWEKTPGFRILPGATADLGAVAIGKGVVLSLRLRDPTGLMGRYRPSNPGISIGILTPAGAYHPAALAGEGPEGLEFRITVPPGRALDLWVHSLKYVIRDDSNSEVEPQGRRYPFQAAAGAPPISRGFTLQAQRGQR